MRACSIGQNPGGLLAARCCAGNICFCHGFGRELQIPPFSMDTFSSHNTDPFQGTDGSVTYAGDGITLLVGWDDPRIGTNHTSHDLQGTNKGRFLVTRESGTGDEKAQNLYVLSFHPTYSVRSSLSQLGDVGRGIRALA